MVGPCDFSVRPSPFGLDFGTLDSGLTKMYSDSLLLLNGTKNQFMLFINKLDLRHYSDFRMTSG